MQQVNLIQAIQENSGFFNKIILRGQFSLGSVGDVHLKNLVFVVACLIILLCSALKSCTYVFRKQRCCSLCPHQCTGEYKMLILMYVDKMYMCKFPLNPTPSMGEDCPLSRRKVMKDVLYSGWSASGKKESDLRVIRLVRHARKFSALVSILKKM